MMLSDFYFWTAWHKACLLIPDSDWDVHRIFLMSFVQIGDYFILIKVSLFMLIILFRPGG